MFSQVEGSIYLFSLIAPSHQNLLIELQNNLAELTNPPHTTNTSSTVSSTEPSDPELHNPGNLEFNRFRAFKNQVREMEEPVRFVDGELIERFLELDEQRAEKACRGLGVGVEEVRELVEGLRRLH